MYLSFREEFSLAPEAIFPYFRSPSEWAKLYGLVKPTKTLEDGWHIISLKKAPFPLKAKNVLYEQDRRVRWIFGGFWRGMGEVNFCAAGKTTVVEGFEYIVPHGAWVFSGLVERRFMEREFRRIWALGWERIRKGKGGPPVSLAT
ncbi:MAG: hypothetical protein AB1921_18365 [Thermodesulfobacteriota bacterium]